MLIESYFKQNYSIKIPRIRTQESAYCKQCQGELLHIKVWKPEENHLEYSQQKKYILHIFVYEKILTKFVQINEFFTP